MKLAHLLLAKVKNISIESAHSPSAACNCFLNLWCARDGIGSTRDCIPPRYLVPPCSTDAR
jgi:hypothetical protein